MSNGHDNPESTNREPTIPMSPVGDDIVLDRYLHKVLGLPRPNSWERFQKAARKGLFNFLVPDFAAIGDCTVETDAAQPACTYEIVIPEGSIELQLSTILPYVAALVRIGARSFITELRGRTSVERALLTLLEEHGIRVLSEEVLRARSRYFGYDAHGERYRETYYEVLFTNEYVPWDGPGFVTSIQGDGGYAGNIVGGTRSIQEPHVGEWDERRLAVEDSRHLPPRARGAERALPMKGVGENPVLDHFLYQALGPARPDAAAAFQRSAEQGDFDFLIPRFEEFGFRIARSRFQPGQVACVYDIVTPEEKIHIAISTVLPLCAVLLKSGEQLSFTTLEDGLKEHDILRKILAEIHIHPLAEKNLRGRSRYYASGGQRVQTYFELLVGTEDRLPWECSNFTGSLSP